MSVSLFAASTDSKKATYCDMNRNDQTLQSSYKNTVHKSRFLALISFFLTSVSKQSHCNSVHACKEPEDRTPRIPNAGNSWRRWGVGFKLRTPYHGPRAAGAHRTRGWVSHWAVCRQWWKWTGNWTTLATHASRLLTHTYSWLFHIRALLELRNSLRYHSYFNYRNYAMNKLGKWSWMMRRYEFERLL
jgi:hypothetical protein